jgi:hypothetical protein
MPTRLIRQETEIALESPWRLLSPGIWIALALAAMIVAMCLVGIYFQYTRHVHISAQYEKGRDYSHGLALFAI